MLCGQYDGFALARSEKDDSGTDVKWSLFRPQADCEVKQLVSGRGIVGRAGSIKEFFRKRAVTFLCDYRLLILVRRFRHRIVGQSWTGASLDQWMAASSRGKLN